MTELCSFDERRSASEYRLDDETIDSPADYH